MATIPTKKALVHGIGEISGYLKVIRRNVRHFKRVRKVVGSNSSGRLKQVFPFGSYGVGRAGKIRIDQLKKARKKVGTAVVEATKKPADRIDKIVNARAKGIRFIRSNGRIIPMRRK